MFLTNYYHIISILQFCVLSSNFSYNFMCVSNHRVKEKNMARWNHGNDVTRIMENKLDLNEGTFRASYLEWSTIHYHESIENVYGVYKYPFFFYKTNIRLNLWNMNIFWIISVPMSDMHWYTTPTRHRQI
jgi:hypothetical protein